MCCILREGNLAAESPGRWDALDDVKQEIRSQKQRLGNWFQSFLSDGRFALRQQRKSAAFTTVTVLTLALGIGANTAVFSILDAVLIRPLPYPNPKRLVKTATYDLKSGDLYGTSYPDFIDWSEQNHFFDHLAAYEEKTFNLAGTLQPEHVKGDVVSSDFFETLGIEPHEGRSLASAQNQQAVVLSHSLWSRSFASDPHAIGKSITLDGFSYEVIGVMPPGFQFPNPETELWVSITPVRPDLREEMVGAARSNREMSVIGRLNASVDLAQAQAGMAVYASSLAQKYPDSNRDLGVRLVPLQEDMVGEFRLALLILMGSAALVLLIACANIGTLLLARAAARRSEIVIRSSLGATRRRIMAQLLTESLLLAVAGGSLGTLLAFSLIHVLVAGAPKGIPRISSAHINLMVLLFTGQISVLAGVLFGLAPAWQISRGDPGETLKRTARTFERRAPMTRVMVATEIALSLMLLTAAGLLGKSLVLLSRVDPGFRSDHLLTVEVPRSMNDREDARRNWTDFYQQLLARIQALPGVESAGTTLSLPFQGRSWNVSFTVPGRPYASLTDQPQAEARIVSNNYFEVMKIPLRRGRYFSEHDTKNSPHVAVINEMVARLYWPNEDPVGQFIQMPAFGAGHCQVVGIVADIKQTDLSEEPPPGIYLPYTQESMPWQTLVVRTKSDPMGLAAIIRHEIAALDPEQPIARVAALDRLLEASTDQERFRTFLIGSFAGIALLLSAVGIYGVMAYTVNRRSGEIGIRMALGARPVDILKLILGESMTLTLLGVLFGLIGAYSVMRVMRSLLFGVTSTDPFTFASVTLILCFVAFLASYIPARRATHTDSMVTLRYE